MQNPARTPRKHHRLRSALAVLGASLVLGGGFVPMSVSIAHADDNDYTQWEDCDWDGYDDHTGVKVPWPGFDGTKGDTPAGPSENSQTGKKQAAASASASAAASASASASKSPSTASSSSSTKGSPSKTTTKKPTASSSSSASASARPQASASPSAKPSHEPTPTPTPSAVPTGGTGATVAVKGDATAVRAGASVVVAGSGFEPGQSGLVISLRSVAGELATVTADASGAFEATVVLPSDLPAGAHTLSVTREGTELSTIGFDVAQAGTQASATSATSEIPEPLVGAGVLAGLLVVGGGAVGVSVVVRKRRG